MIRKKCLLATTAVPANAGQGYFPDDIQRLYHFPSHLDGTGQTVGILEFSNGYSLNDAVQFWNVHGITPPNVTFVSVDGTRNDGGVHPSDEEASLDLQWIGALAPGTHILVYESDAGDTYQTFSDAMKRTLEYILQETTYQPTVLSISYGDAESTLGHAAVTEWAHLIERLSAKGITVCVASGDQGAYGMHDPNGEPIPHADAPAWDACTGWGSLHATRFVEFLGSLSDTTSLPATLQPPAENNVLVRVQGVIAKIESDTEVDGVSQHHLLIDQIQLLDIKGGDVSLVDSEALCTIRYGDSEGLPEAIPGLETGRSIELQGFYIEKVHVNKLIDNSDAALLHFTHHPHGFIVYNWQLYR